MSKAKTSKAQKRTCKAKTRGGKPCGMRPLAGSRYCYNHDPAMGAKRAQSRKKGGANRRISHHGDSTIIPHEVKTLNDANQILEYVLAEVVPMENSIARARVLLSLYDSFIKSFEIGELEQRIQALEQYRRSPGNRMSARMV